MSPDDRSRARGDKRPERVKLILGLVLRFARKDAGLTQKAVADAFGLPSAALCKLEKGTTTVALWHLDRYGEIVGVPGWALHRAATEIARRAPLDACDTKLFIEAVDALWRDHKTESCDG
jgi:transcriptional regulator with XRE-family HTH domain